jgi:hypothetical protein
MQDLRAAFQSDAVFFHRQLAGLFAKVLIAIVGFVAVHERPPVVKSACAAIQRLLLGQLPSFGGTLLAQIEVLRMCQTSAIVGIQLVGYLVYEPGVPKRRVRPQDIFARAKWDEEGDGADGVLLTRLGRVEFLAIRQPITHDLGDDRLSTTTQAVAPVLAMLG